MANANDTGSSEARHLTWLAKIAPAESAMDVRPSLTILWQDDELIAVHKPAGWLVHRSGIDAHETHFVMQTLRDQIGRHVYPVHRLDKGTSGVLLWALRPDAARAMAAIFESRLVRKEYLAMVRGWPQPPDWTVDHPLQPDDAPADAPSQDAVTQFTRLATLQLDVPVDRYPTTRVALVKAQPRTGRWHQIRRHLKHVSHPIIGDATHGKGQHNRWWAQHLGRQRLWLHALGLSFEHPRTRAPIRICSPIAAHAPSTTSESLNQDWAILIASMPWRFDSSLPFDQTIGPILD